MTSLFVSFAEDGGRAAEVEFYCGVVRGQGVGVAIVVIAAVRIIGVCGVGDGGEGGCVDD